MRASGLVLCNNSLVLCCVFYDCFRQKKRSELKKMSLFVCKCLNVTLESDEIDQNVDIEKLELTSNEQRDLFFSEKHLLISGNIKKSISQPALTSQRSIGRWVLHYCLACGQTTHAVLLDRPNTVLIPKSMQTTRESINSLKRSDNFSQVFNLLVPEVTTDVEMKENIDTSNVLGTDNKLWAPTQQAIGSLNKQLNEMLQSQLETVEDSVRQFRDQQYAEYEAYRERAQRDHKILASIINKTRSSTDSDYWRMDTSLDNGPTSPQLPPLQRRRLSSIKDAKKLGHNSVKQINRSLPPEEDSLDSEDIFDLEGMDSRNDMGSDQDDYDSDNSGSHDEGIHIARTRGGGHKSDIAHSLPINMPNFPHETRALRDLDDDEEPAQDIAASIKALAKSVHGDVFELPRPRFSTQI